MCAHVQRGYNGFNLDIVQTHAPRRPPKNTLAKHTQSDALALVLAHCVLPDPVAVPVSIPTRFPIPPYPLSTAPSCSAAS